MRNKGFHEELTKDTSDTLNLDILGGASFDPFLGLGPGLIESEETALSSPLDQLVWFGDELGAGSEKPWVDDLGLTEDILDRSVFREVKGGESGRRVVSGGGRERSWFDNGSTSEVIIEDGLAVGLEDGFSGHGGGR